MDDLLYSPVNPSFPLERTPFYPWKERWDGGPFLKFASRKNELRRVPLELRSSGLLDVNILNIANDTPPLDNQAFSQTWFFFGLLAEMFELNEQEDGSRILKQEEVEAELNFLYEKFVDKANGLQYISGKLLLEFDVQMKIMGRVTQGRNPKEMLCRLKYLQECLYFTYNMIVRNTQAGLQHSVHFSICALGEFFNTSLSELKSSGFAGVALPWYQNYLDPGTVIEGRMLDEGWCISDIQRIRELYQGLNTQSYISRLKIPGKDTINNVSPGTVPRNHFNCTKNKCTAAEIKPGTYQLSHSEDDSAKSCSVIEVDVDKVNEVLLGTETKNTFPILRFEVPNGQWNDATITVKAYTGVEPYVAMSHVWADGLGNYDANALQRCQIAHIAQKVQELQIYVESLSSTRDAPYWIWIDTLCCPVKQDSEGKKMALERIATVYRKATHVLVFDSSISTYSTTEIDAAERFLRALGTSIWMRRLWTLQEGSLAKSLYFQFKDRPVSLVSLLAEFWQKGAGDQEKSVAGDPRLIRIWKDMNLELSRIHAFSPHENSSGQSEAGQNVHFVNNTAEKLWKVQSSLYHRAVSFPSDEALCLSTLLSLDINYIQKSRDGNERMARVWELVGRENAIPPRVIFYVENPLPLPKFGWAPKSLLSSANSTLSHDEVTARLNSLLTFLPDYAKDNPINQPASLHEFGLKVQFPGLSCTLQPWWDNGPVYPWKGFVKASEDSVTCYETSTKKWFRMVDFFRGKDSPWTPEKLIKLDEEDPDPLFKDLVRGRIALIRDVKSSGKKAPTVYLMVRLRSDHDTFPSSFQESTVQEPAELFVEIRRTVTLIDLDRDEALMMDVAREIVTKIHEHRIFIDDNSDQESKIHLKNLMKEYTAKAWEDNPQFVRAVYNNFGPDMEERAWALLPIFLRYNIVLNRLPENQGWIVDGKLQI